MSTEPILSKKCTLNLDDYPEDGIFEILLDLEIEETCSLNERTFLLIAHQGKYHVIENKCGHFGVPLSDGKIRENEIVCAEHGISFDLDTGEVVNRPYENCDPLKVLAIEIKGRVLYLSGI